MPPALRVLVLATTILCIFLLFSTFFLDGILNKKYITLKKEFSPSYKESLFFKNKSNILVKGTSTIEGGDASSTLKLLPVYDFVESAKDRKSVV